MTDTARALVALNPTDIKVAGAVILDWFDGPREGILHLANPVSSWHFRLHAEGTPPAGTSLFLLAALPDSSRERIDSALAVLPRPAGRIWVPIWAFPDPEAQRRADAVVDEVVDSAGGPEVIVSSTDLASIDRAWLYTR